MDTAPPEPPRYALLARSVLRRIQEELASERAAAAARVQIVLPRVEASIEALRAEGVIGEAWLFGSYAEGVPTASSDVDVLIDLIHPTHEDLQRVTERLEDALGLQVDAHALHAAPPSLVAKARDVGMRL